MVIRISLGNVGSGKTAMEVRNMFHNPTRRLTYSNIITKGLDNSKVLKPDMIIKKEIVRVKKKRDGNDEAVYDYRVNFGYWKAIKEPINVVLDEAHSILNARRAMSKTNVLISDWLALIRRVIGESSSGTGELVLISQLPRRLDVIAKEMAHQVKYHVCHYNKTCKQCGATWSENSEMPEPLWSCPVCNHYSVEKHSHVIEVRCFAGIDAFIAWKEWGFDKGCYARFFVNDIENYFKFYDTLQWDNLFSEFY